MNKWFYIITITVLILLGWVLRSLIDKPKIEYRERIVSVIDTIIVKDTVYLNGKAKIIYITDTLGVPEKVATYDSVSNGFEAHIKYHTKQELFDNTFIIPEKIITKETIKTLEKITYIEDFNKYEVAAGLRFNFLDREIRYKPYIAFNYNIKLFKSLVWENQLRLLVQFKGGSFLFEPEGNTQLILGL